jgi:hypothetical protein
VGRILVLLMVLAGSAAGADDVVHPGTPQLDRPTLMALGVKLPVTGDDNYNAAVEVRYRAAGGAPDLGALELGCPVPLYGPRREGIDETNKPLGCEPPGE